MRQLLVTLLLLGTWQTAPATIPWPMEPFDQSQPLGNSYGEYQNYGSYAYLHPGIDIMHPPGTPVYAVKAGWVKAVLTTSEDLHWRVAVGDSATAAECDGWLYAHLDQFSIPVMVGQHVDSGEFLGTLVTWPTAEFHHLHFVKIRHSGLNWTPDWQFVGNPLDELVDVTDSSAPYFLEITPGYKLRFCRDNANSFFSAGAPVYGDVDIITKAHDTIGHPDWVVTPYALGYEICSDSVWLGPFVSFVFTGRLLWDQSHHVVFKNAYPCDSEGHYYERSFYEILTNHDSDTLITLSDAEGHWATGSVPNDVYMVRVWAADRAGNITWDSMAVATENFYDLAGEVTFSDGNPSLGGTDVTIPYSVSQTTTSESGSFELLSQPAGRYPLTAEREGYLTLVENLEVFTDDFVSLVMEPGPYLPGDVSNDGVVNVSDAVYLLGFIFGGGPYPVPWAAAVEIDPSPIVNVSDAVYLIAYIFGGGPPPGEG